MAIQHADGIHDGRRRLTLRLKISLLYGYYKELLRRNKRRGDKINEGQQRIKVLLKGTKEPLRREVLKKI